MNRYCNLSPAVAIEDDFPKISTGFDLVQASIDNMPAFMARNALINGNLDVAQRFPTVGAIMTNPFAGQYLLDRFYFSQNVGASGVFPTISASRQALTPGDIPNSYYFFRVNPNGAGTQSTVDSFYTVRQGIENGTRYLCGNGKKVTVSFWARSSIAGKKIAVNIKQQYGTGGSPSALEELVGSTFTLTSTWTQYTYTFTTNTLVGKTFGTNNDDQLTLLFWYEWGSSFISRFGASTNESFVGAGNIDIAQVQVCAGDVAIPFQPHRFAEELALCQRYYEKSYELSALPGAVTSAGVWHLRMRDSVAASTAGTLFVGMIPFKTRKRVVPTTTIYSPSGVSGAVRVDATDRTGVTLANVSENGISSLSVSNASATVINQDQVINIHYIADAEL